MIMWWSPASWITSVSQSKRASEWINEAIWQGVFSGRVEGREHPIGIFNAHVESVVTSISNERLLLLLEEQQEWKPLCDFLECPVPDESYPLENSSEEYLSRGGRAVSN